MTSTNKRLNEWLNFVKIHNELFEDRKISPLAALKTFVFSEQGGQDGK